MSQGQSFEVKMNKLWSGRLLCLLILCLMPAHGRAHTAIYPANTGELTGVVTESADCTVSDGDFLQLSISVRDTALYQMEIPDHGTFEVHLNPGKYNIVASNKKGCFAVSQPQVTANTKTELNLKVSFPPTPNAAKK